MPFLPDIKTRLFEFASFNIKFLGIMTDRDMQFFAPCQKCPITYSPVVMDDCSDYPNKIKVWWLNKLILSFGENGIEIVNS